MLDDATIDRVERVHTEQLEYVDIYDPADQPLANRKAVGGSNTQTGPMEKQNQQLRAVTMEVLALAGELRKGTIDRILEMSDLELGLQGAPRRPIIRPG